VIKDLLKMIAEDRAKMKQEQEQASGSVGEMLQLCRSFRGKCLPAWTPEFVPKAMPRSAIMRKFWNLRYVAAYPPGRLHRPVGSLPKLRHCLRRDVAVRDQAWRLSSHRPDGERCGSTVGPAMTWQSARI